MKSMCDKEVITTMFDSRIQRLKPEENRFLMTDAFF